MAHDKFLIFVPDSPTLPRLAWREDAVRRAMYELGPKAQVWRVTLGHVSRDVTSDFIEKPVDDYEDEDVADRRYRAEQSRKFTFGTRSL